MQTLGCHEAASLSQKGLRQPNSQVGGHQKTFRAKTLGFQELLSSGGSLIKAMTIGLPGNLLVQGATTRSRLSQSGSLGY